MRISDQSKLLEACKEACTTWQRYMDDTRPVGAEEWGALVAAMSGLVRVVVEIERERMK